MAAKIPQCLLCAQEAEPLLVILDQVICPSCEKLLLAASCQEEAYDELLESLRPLAELILARAC